MHVSRLTLIGPVSMAVGLDAERLHLSSYASTQEAVASRLNQVTPIGKCLWHYDPAQETELLFTPPGFANRVLLPLAFLRLEADELRRGLAAHFSASAVRWVVERCTVDFFSFAVAAVRIDLRYEATDRAVPEAACVETLSQQLSGVIWPYLQEAVKQFVDGVRATCTDLIVEQPTQRTRHDGLLWLQRVARWLVDDLDEVRGAAQRYVPTVSEVLSYRDQLIVAGVDTSVICTRNGSSENDEWVLRVFALEAAVGASLLNVDGWLFDQLNQVVLEGETETRSQASANVRTTQATFERVELHLTKIDSTVMFLGSASVAVWQARARVSALPELERAIQRKLSALERLANTRHTEIERVYSRRLNHLALLFTIVGGVSASIALIDFTQGGAWLGPSVSRMLVLAGLILVAAAAAAMAIREVRIRRDR